MEFFIAKTLIFCSVKVDKKIIIIIMGVTRILFKKRKIIIRHNRLEQLEKLKDVVVHSLYMVGICIRFQPLHRTSNQYI